MRKQRKWIAALLTAVMLFTVLPSAAFAGEPDIGGELSEEQSDPVVDIPSEEETSQESPETPVKESTVTEEIPGNTVFFNTQYLDIEIGYDVEKAERGETPYVLFEEDGSYTIGLVEESPFFPYEVQFTYQGRTTTEWFMDENDCVVVGGHPFYVNCLAGTPNHIGLQISGEYVPVFPEEKVFVNDPDYGVAPASLLPLQEVRVNANLTGYLPAELAEVGVDAVLTGQSVPDGAAVVWAKGYAKDNYTIADKSAKLDLRPTYGSEQQIHLELIVGTADQLDVANTRYIVTAQICPLSDVLEFSAYTEAGKELAVYDQYYATNSDGNYYQLGIGEGEWTEGPARISMDLNSEFAGKDALRAVVYEGRYTSAEDLPTAGSGKEVSDIWNTAGTNAHLGDYSNWQIRPEFTVVLYRGDEIAQIIDFGVYMYLSTFSLSPNSYLYAESESQYQINRPYASANWNYDGTDYRTYMFSMRNGYPADGSYYLNLHLYNPDPSATDGGTNGINYVKKAVVGDFKTEAEAADEADIKSQLFSDASSSGGYKANYSQGITFTVFTTTGQVLTLTVKAAEDVELPSAPSPLSADTYFRMNGAYKSESSSAFNSYVMPYSDDSYYYNGYQTVFLLNGTQPLTDGIEIYPSFYTGNKVTAFAGHDKISGTKQISGETLIIFESGRSIPYSAAAENDRHLKNYWVTFLTQQSGAKLFVNGATNADPSHCDDDGTPVREIFMDDAHGNHHDIFFANIGDEPLTGLYVKLENAQNVKLDDYWTIREGTSENTLAAFDTTSKKMSDSAVYSSYGELKNVAKVRLMPDGSGLISGTLVIGSQGSGEEVRIRLTGTAGVPKITTEKVVDGVKYVPYSSVIQTNNMYASDAVVFELVAGTLPAGVVVKPNGEVYGVPQFSGTFTFTVRASYNGDASLFDEKEFTLTITENTDENVYTATDPGYTVLYPIGDETEGGAYHFVVTDLVDQTFRSQGEFGCFVDLWLDGRRLTRGVDYLAESGSTVITIFGETLDSNDTGDEGTHTIAAEFREGDETGGSLKRAAQNYVIKNTSQNEPSTPSTPSKPSNPSAPTTPSKPTTSKPSDNSSDKSPAKPADPGQTTTPDEPAMPFTDVLPPHWFYDDVKWIYTNGIMQGISATLFAPDEPISQATIVTVFARVLKIDLTQFDGVTDPDIEPNQWYTNAAIWAKQSGLLPDYSKFTGTDVLSRDGMAIMLVKYLRSTGVDTSVPASPVVFEDAEWMTKDGDDAFQVLYHYGIFKGVGGLRMEPAASTSRAEFAALMHRMSVFIAAR